MVGISRHSTYLTWRDTYEYFTTKYLKLENTNLYINTETILNLLQFCCDKFYTLCLGKYLGHCYLLSLCVRHLNLPIIQFSYNSLNTLVELLLKYCTILNFSIYFTTKERGGLENLNYRYSKLAQQIIYYYLTTSQTTCVFSHKILTVIVCNL